mgnify:CR=1 FL=1
MGGTLDSVLPVLFLKTKMVLIELYTRHYDFCITLPLEGAMMYLSPIGSRIKAARENKKITQEELSALLDMSTTHISVIERRVKQPKLKTFIRVANVLGVSADRLLMDVIEDPADVVTGELAKSISISLRKYKRLFLWLI